MADLVALSRIDLTEFSFVLTESSEFVDGAVRSEVGGKISEFRGALISSASGEISGRVDSYSQSDGNQLKFEFTGLNFDAAMLFDLIEGGKSEDALAALLASQDYLIGSGFSDNLNGFDGDDRLEGAGGDDVLMGGSGDDFLDGSIGMDVSVLQSSRDNYSIEINPFGAKVHDRRSSGDGTDLVSNVELLQFEDSTWELSRFDGGIELSPEAFTTFAEMYIAYFNRAPDSEGLFFWADALSTGVTLDEIAALFFDQPETRALYPNPDDVEGFVEAVYGNVLGRAIDQEGFDFWVSVLREGSIARPSFMLEVLRGAKAPLPEEASAAFRAQKEADIAYLSSKTEIGLYYSAVLGMNDVSNARTAMELFDGTNESIGLVLAEIDKQFDQANVAEGGQFLVSMVGIVGSSILEAHL